MIEYACIPFSIPELPIDPEKTIETRSILGPYGITAAVESFADVIEWQEKRKGLSQGYYRLIYPPKLQAFKAVVEKRYSGRTCVLYSSGALAVKEWIEFVSVTLNLELVSLMTEEIPRWADAAIEGASGVSVQLCAGEALPGSLAFLDAWPEPNKLPHADCVVLHLEDQGVQAGIALVRECGDFSALDLYERNRRRGGALSVRNLEWLLGEKENHTRLCDEDVSALQSQLAEMEKANHAFLFPTGMCAVTAALDLLRREAKPKVFVLGNVYRDTHILLEDFQWAGLALEGVFLESNDLAGLAAGLESADVAAVFLETITNPLGEIPDLPKAVALCKAADVPLIVDSTMATPANCNPLALGATIVIHSTSKFLSGANNHGGGVVMCSDTDWADALLDYQRAWHVTLSPLEAATLSSCLQTFPSRMNAFNRNGTEVARYLRSHPKVGRVYHEAEGEVEWVKGACSLLAFTLKDRSEEALGRFWDADLQPIHQAPSLGSNETLLCPYVMLTYYGKSDAYLESHRLPRHLIRVAVGCEEDLSEVLAALERGLGKV